MVVVTKAWAPSQGQMPYSPGSWCESGQTVLDCREIQCVLVFVICMFHTGENICTPSSCVAEISR